MPSDLWFPKLRGGREAVRTTGQEGSSESTPAPPRARVGALCSGYWGSASPDLSSAQAGHAGVPLTSSASHTPFAVAPLRKHAQISSLLTSVLLLPVRSPRPKTWTCQQLLNLFPVIILAPPLPLGSPFHSLLLCSKLLVVSYLNQAKSEALTVVCKIR